MKSKFSIGEMAKIHNVSIQALRHYDKLGLLKPSYINKETGYRYYSAKDFIIIDLIKQCKSMGLSLDEIKEITENYTSPQSILEIIEKQKILIDLKLKELISIKNNITFLEDNIRRTLDEGLNNIFISNYGDREFITYDNTNRFTEEFELNLSRVLADTERKYQYFNKELAFVISRAEFEVNGIIKYLNMLLRFTEGVEFPESHKLVIPKGKYVTINFDDTYNDTKKYYDILKEYIQENNLITVGDYYELYVITRVGVDGKEKSLGKIQIKVEDN